MRPETCAHVGEGGARVGNEGDSDDRRLSRLNPGGQWDGCPTGRDCVKVEHVLAVDPRRAAPSLIGAENVGLKPTLLAGDGAFPGFGGTGEMTCKPRGVIEPRRGCWVCMYIEGCATAITDGMAGAEEGDVGGDGLWSATSCSHSLAGNNIRSTASPRECSF